MICLENVTRKYGGFAAVDNVSFTISPGEIVGLLGHNGAGKTTIMKMLTGYLEPTAGSITIGGENLADQLQTIQQDIGYLPENCPVYPEMTVLDYLDYSAALHGVAPQDRAKLVLDAVARTALVEKGGQMIATLSRGYRQRTGVAQAILHKPKILILDEPTNGLDPTQIQQMRELIKELATHSTVIISTHILQEVQAVCDRVIIISNGKKVIDSRLDALQENSRLMVSVGGDEKRVYQDLCSIDGVARVTNAPESSAYGEGITFALDVTGNGNRHQVAAAVAQKVHSEGHALYSMAYEAKDLESVFAQCSAQ